MEKLQTTIQIDRDVHKMLKVFCAEHNLKINDWVSGYLRNYFTKNIEEIKNAQNHPIL